MSGIAGIIHWDGAPVAADDLQRMMRLMNHRGPDGIQFEIDGPLGLAHACMALRREELQWRTQPVWLPNRSKAIVADARLYNRDDLLSRLGAVEWFREFVSDAEIILALFERYGEATPDLLDGDFVFVVWDVDSRRVFAARDPFGVKPLVYWSRGDRFVFASEPKQILALPYVPVEPDELAVGEVLVNRYQDAGRTFYKDVCLLRPGHSLFVSAGKRMEVRHWNPDPQRLHSFTKPDDCFEEFRSHLKRAVSRRLQIDYPAVAELSGGYDSSAIVVMAAAAYRENSVSFPRLETLTALYPGLDCDEREYSEAVSETVPFPRRTYSAWEVERCIGAAEDLRRLDAPYLHPPDGESLALGETLSGAGARILLTGICGDEITLERPILQDLAAAGSYWSLARLLWSFQSGAGTARSRYPLALIRLALPLWLRRAIRTVRPQQPWRAPSWLNTGFAVRLEEYFRSPVGAVRRFPSGLQQAVYGAMSSARTHRVLEIAERRRAYQGVELRHPFADRALVEFVLAIRFEDRIPDSGRLKYILRRALFSDLPGKVRERSDKTGFGPMQQAGLRELINRSDIRQASLAGAYIREANYLAMMSAEAAGTESKVDSDLMRIVGTERWLEQFGDVADMGASPIPGLAQKLSL